MDNQLWLAGRWPVGPHRIDGVAVDGDQLCALLRQRLGGLVDPSFRVQPGIIADPGTAGGMLAQPFGHAALRHADILPMFRVHLLAYLKRVAPLERKSVLLGKSVSVRVALG